MIKTRWYKMDVLKTLFKEKTEEKENEEPEFTQNKIYRLCVEDNPNKRGYRCGRRDTCTPDCKLTLHIEELSRLELVEIDLEIRGVLERHGFRLR
jgi:hypothetical protein